MAAKKTLESVITAPSNYASSVPLAENKHLLRWVDKMAELTKPAAIHWVDGSQAEYDSLCAQMVEHGTFIKLNEKQWPGCFYARSDARDVARVEERTFICSLSKDNAGPTNNWEDPFKMRRKLKELFRGAMRGRTMYVLPFSMGPVGSPMSQIGVQLTDSPYVVVNMRIMAASACPSSARSTATRSASFPACTASACRSRPASRCAVAVQRRRSTSSTSPKRAKSGRTAPATAATPCSARSASRCASPRTSPATRAGWPSTCSSSASRARLTHLERREDLRRRRLSQRLRQDQLRHDGAARGFDGWKVWTVGDDIAWIQPDANGQLRAINPEAGFFGVAPGTSVKTNPNAMATLSRNTVFTNVALTPDGGVWWEGMTDEPPAECLDWQGKVWTPAIAKQTGAKAAHPNGRFTAPASQCPCIDSDWEAPEGVPISAIIFGGRRSSTIPLVYQAFNWSSGVYAGATMGSETTAAAAGAVGQVRRDPMAMLPFCGYHMGDYFRHWIKMQRTLNVTPRIFHVNWFRKDANGKFLWPGFGENIRVLKWIVDRVRGRAQGKETPIGWTPHYRDIEWNGLDFPREAFEELQHVDRSAWRKEVMGHEELFIALHDHLPPEMVYERELLICRL
jgi:phosphoenolpyruvate carboxykinase (GTP)